MRARRRGGHERPWMDPRDLWSESLAGVLARPVRSALTTLGTVLGIGTLVITIGVAATAANQIAGRFDALTATSVTVVAPPVASGPPLVEWSGVEAVERLAGVESAAALSDSEGSADVQVRANDVVAPGALTEQTLAVVAATPALPEAVRGAMATGRFFDGGDIARHERVAVLGDQAARLLGIDDVRDAPAVFFEGQSYTVIGVLGGFRRETRLSASVILPPTTAADRMGLKDVTRVLVNTSLGAARQVARQAPIALAPGHEEALTVTAPPDLSKARKESRATSTGCSWCSGWSRWSWGPSASPTSPSSPSWNAPARSGCDALSARPDVRWPGSSWRSPPPSGCSAASSARPWACWPSSAWRP